MLTTEEIDILIEALSAWESKSDTGEMMGELFGALLCRGDKEAEEKMEKELITRREKTESLKKKRQEESILIKAKLIQIRKGIYHH